MLDLTHLPLRVAETQIQSWNPTNGQLVDDSDAVYKIRKKKFTRLRLTLNSTIPVTFASA